MGRRAASCAFMPGVWVFPGGRVERADARAPYRSPLDPGVSAVLEKRLSPERARAAALAAIRETFEETGVRFAAPAGEPPTAPPLWAGFCAPGRLAPLAALDLAARAVTPTDRSKRFDCYFFFAEGSEAEGEPAPGPEEELDQVGWVGLDTLAQRPTHSVTRFVLGEIQAMLDAPRPPRGLYVRRGRARTAPL